LNQTISRPPQTRETIPLITVCRDRYMFAGKLSITVLRRKKSRCCQNYPVPMPCNSCTQVVELQCTGNEYRYRTATTTGTEYRYRNNIPGTVPVPSSNNVPVPDTGSVQQQCTGYRYRYRIATMYGNTGNRWAEGSE
jgi:hypothetical protein